MAVTLKFEPFATGSGWLNPVIKFTGLSLFFLAMVAFIFITITLLIRFLRYPKTFIPAFTRPKEDIFTATFFLSLAAMASSGVEYGRLVLPSDIQTGLASFLHVAFWVYLAVTFLSSLAQYQCLFTAEKGLRFVPKELSPGWIMPIFPVMLSGTFAAACVPGLKADQALRVLSAGLVAQGLGMMVAVFFYGAYLTRLVLLGLPHHRQAMFIAVGPPSFTCLALIGLGGEVPRILAELGGGHIYGGIERGFMGLVLTSSELQVLAAGVKLLAVYASLFLWGLSFWFLGISLVALYPELPEKEFRLSWWSFVFPNVGFVLSTLKMGAALGSDGLSWFRVAMSGLLFLVWLFVFYRCIRGVVKREIVWEGRDEDHVEQPAAPTPQT
jgi:tellurite resistance protein TehA-like permease